MNFSGKIAGDSKEITYRECQLSCKIIKETINTVIPPTITDVNIKSCNECRKSKCNSSTVTQAVAVLLVAMFTMMKML